MKRIPLCICAFTILLFCLILPARAQGFDRPTVRITGGGSYPYTVGLLNNWLAAAGYMPVPPESPARYECRINGIQEQYREAGGGISTPWFTSHARGGAWRARVLFALYDANRQLIFDSATFDAGTANTYQGGDIIVSQYNGNFYGSGDTISDAIRSFIHKLPAAPKPNPDSYNPLQTHMIDRQTVDQHPITLWIDITDNHRRAIISGVPGTKFWTRFYAVNRKGQRMQVTSTDLRTIDARGSYTLWSEAEEPRIVDIICEGETSPRRTIIMIPGGKPAFGEHF